MLIWPYLFPTAGSEHLELILDYTGWVLKENPEDGLKVIIVLLTYLKPDRSEPLLVADDWTLNMQHTVAVQGRFSIYLRSCLALGLDMS